MLALALYNCSGGKGKSQWTADEYFAYAKEQFNDEDYFVAATEFKIVRLRYAGSTIADSAQFFYAESHFMMEDWLIASVEYSNLINNMSHSPLVKRAQFRLAECYDKLTPRAELDQVNAHNAIREYQSFIEDFPTDADKEEAEKRISELRDKLGQKEFQNAEIYRKMERFRAADIYYNIVLAKYYDTAWADDAILGKAKAFHENEQYELAQSELEKLSTQFPNSDLLSELEQLQAEIKEDMAENDEK